MPKQTQPAKRPEANQEKPISIDINIWAAALVVVIIALAYTYYDSRQTIETLQSSLKLTSDNLEKTIGQLSSALAEKNTLNKTVLQQEVVIRNQKNEIKTKSGRIKYLNEYVQNLTGTIAVYEEIVESQESLIVQAEAKVEELTSITEDQSSRIQALLEASQSEQGELLVEEYSGTIIMYDNVEIYSKFHPMFQDVRNTPQDYSKLGIPFIYFRGISTQTEDGSIILGQYSSLYDYIFINRDADSSLVIFHEIAHIIFKRYFVNVPENLNVWINLYAQLKENDYLSSPYSYQDEVEGFSEEYAYYKTGKNPDQPPAVKDLFQQIDGFLAA